MPSSVRSSIRRGGEIQSLGLEDELSFGSDEDLMETIGEIDVPDRPDPGPESHKLRKGFKSAKSASSSKTSSKSSKSNSNPAKGSNSLATAHILPPLPPVPALSSSSLDVLDSTTIDMGDRDRPKRGSIMGFKLKKGLRRFRDEQNPRGSFSSEGTQSMASLQKVASNTSSRPSIASSGAACSPISTHTHGSSAAPHIAPLSLPSLDSPDRSSLSMHSVAESFESKTPRRFDSVPALSPIATGAAARIPLPHNPGATWSPTEISHAILPAFPATLSSLEPITVFTTQASKRPPSSILSGTERGPSGFRQPSLSASWTPCTLVFTLFKVTLSGKDAVVANANCADLERTVAHVHVFGGQRANGSPNIRRAKSSAVLLDASTPRVESERRLLSRDSTASICDNYTDADGRHLVLSIYFGNEDRTKAGNEWILAMKDGSEVREWTRQIRKTAIMINAEELGYGRAIRPVYEDTIVSADELAQQLSIHARAVAESHDKATGKKVENGKRPNADLESASSTQSIMSQQEPRRASLEALQGVAMNRSHSAGAADAPFAGRSRRNEVPKSVKNGIPPADTPEDDLESIVGLSLSGLNFGSSLSFPAPPSALPLPPPRRTTGSQKSSPSGSGSSSPAAASTPHMGTVGNFTTSSNDSLASIAQDGKGLSTPLLATPTFNTAVLPDLSESEVAAGILPRPPTPPKSGGVSENSTPRPSAIVAFKNSAPESIKSTSSASSSTARLRRLRVRSQAIDIMSEFSQIEAENMPPAEDEVPIRTDREIRIRFAD